MLLLFGLALFAQEAAAQTYPDRPIRLISPNPAGGANDTIVRIIAAKMSMILGGSFIIDNRGGAGGKIGAEAAARAAPDGYTLLAGSVSTHSFAPLMPPKPGYDPIKDFEPISLLALVQNVLVVNPSLPVANVAELIALAKAQPGKLNYASGGPGSTSHFAVAMFVALAGIQNETVHIPFKGGAPAMTATMANDTQFYFGPMAGMVPYIEAGSVRALAVSGDARSPSLPNIPTMSEAGQPKYKAVGWFGLLAPAEDARRHRRQAERRRGRSGEEPGGHHRPARAGDRGRQQQPAGLCGVRARAARAAQEAGRGRRPQARAMNRALASRPQDKMTSVR